MQERKRFSPIFYHLSTSKILLVAQYLLGFPLIIGVLIFQINALENPDNWGKFMHAFYLSFGIIILIFGWLDLYILSITRKKSIISVIWSSVVIKIIAKLSLNAYLVFPMVEFFAVYSTNNYFSLRSIEVTMIELYVTIVSYLISFLLIVFIEWPYHKMINSLYQYFDKDQQTEEDQEVRRQLL